MITYKQSCTCDTMNITHVKPYKQMESCDSLMKCPQNTLEMHVTTCEKHSCGFSVTARVQHINPYISDGVHAHMHESTIYNHKLSHLIIQCMHEKPVDANDTKVNGHAFMNQAGMTYCIYQRHTVLSCTVRSHSEGLTSEW